MQQSGVYLLFDDQGELIYVGVAGGTSCFDKRIWTHDAKKQFKDHPRRWIDLIPLNENVAFLAVSIEEFLITRLNPRHNRIKRTR